MCNSEILDVVQRAIRNETGDSTVIVTLRTQASDVPGWDSLAHGRILLSIEVELGLRIDIDATYRAADVGELVKIIQEAQGSGH